VRSCPRSRQFDAAVRGLDATLATVDAGAVDRMDKVDDFVAFRAYPFRVAYWMSASLGILALLLTLSGMYGGLSYLVSMRSKEIGIRLALGDTARGAATVVLAQSMVTFVRHPSAKPSIRARTPRLDRAAVPVRVCFA
jgi:hypothetical protein